MANDIRTRLIDIVTNQMGISLDDFQKLLDDSKPIDFHALGVDSLDNVELVMETETEFDINISDDESESIRTFQDLEELVKRKLFG